MPERFLGFLSISALIRFLISSLYILPSLIMPILRQRDLFHLFLHIRLSHLIKPIGKYRLGNILSKQTVSGDGVVKDWAGLTGVCSTLCARPKTDSVGC